MSPRIKSLHTSAEFFFPPSSLKRLILKTYSPKRFMFEYKDLHFPAWFLKLITWRRVFTRRTLKMHAPYVLPPAAVPNVPPCFKLMSLLYIRRHSAAAQQNRRLKLRVFPLWPIHLSRTWQTSIRSLFCNPLHFFYSSFPLQWGIWMKCSKCSKWWNVCALTKMLEIPFQSPYGALTHKCSWNLLCCHMQTCQVTWAN